MKVHFFILTNNKIVMNGVDQAELEDIINFLLQYDFVLVFVFILDIYFFLLLFNCTNYLNCVRLRK